ncbi:YceI family protein [Arcticibacterium luteifluviistationis]|nr:YceI family protein [Arcticibacterium luteifluviistationis]
MKKNITALSLIVLIGLTNICYAQAIYHVQKNSSEDIRLKGTSTLHDWEMKAGSVSGEAQFIFKKSTEIALTSIKFLSFDLRVKDLKSDNKGLDKNAYEALKADKYEEIGYKLSSVKISEEKGGFLLKTNGKLSVAGVTKDIVMDVHAVVKENGAVSCKGSYKLKMTDYNVKPPSFLLGAMKTGDDIMLYFSVTYIQ